MDNLIIRNISEEHASIEERGDGTQWITGYGAVYYAGSPGSEYHLFGNAYERFCPGCFDDVLSRGDNIEVRYNHSNDFLLGQTEDSSAIIRGDSKGIKYETKYVSDDVDHQKVRSKISRKLIKGSSIACYPRKVEWKQEGDKQICLIRSVEKIRDLGPVNRPAYTEATAGIIKRSYDEWQQQMAETESRLKKFEEIK